MALGLPAELLRGLQSGSGVAAWPAAAQAPAAVDPASVAAPIADLDGYLLVADLRPGSLKGQIVAFEKVDADDGTATWLSIGDLLLDLIVAIETGTPFDGWDPTVVEGRLVWRLPG